MKYSGILLATVIATACCGAARSDDDPLWGWSVSAGANFGFGLKTRLRTSTAAAIKAAIGAGPTREAAMAAAKPVKGGGPVVYGKDANGDWYVDADSSWGGDETTNWRLPDDTIKDEFGNPRYVEGEAFVMDGGEYVDLEANTARDLVDTDRDVAFGASIDLSHMLYESEDGSWGIDVSFGLTWMRANDCYRDQGVVAGIEHGNIRTTIPAECLGDPYGSAEADNTWGSASYYGSAGSGRQEPTIKLSNISTVPTPSGSDPLYTVASGDYEEWEISALLKPWYDVNDWLCLHAAIGVGVTRSSLEYEMEAICRNRVVYGSSQEFDEWRVYGIAGAGFLLRAGDFDISCDGLFRWLQHDMEINGRDVHGTLEKPWGVLRVGLSYYF